MPQYGIAIIGDKRVPVEIVKMTIVVRPLEGHLGNGIEPETEVDDRHLIICNDLDEAEKFTKSAPDAA